MTIKRIIKGLLPYALVRLYQRWRYSPKSEPNIWEGIYEHFSQVPVSGPGHFGEEWVHNTLVWTRIVKNAFDSDQPVPAAVASEHNALALLAAILCQQKGSARILDVGGGMGMGYLVVANAQEQDATIDYRVFDTPEVCAAARELFAGDRRITFQSELPEEIDGLDVINVSGALQYFDDYRGLLKRLASYGAAYVLFGFFQAGAQPAFATAQMNIRGSAIPAWFFNRDEIIALMRDFGYEVQFDARSEWPYKQANFPESHRMRNVRTMLFRKASVRTPSAAGQNSARE